MTEDKMRTSAKIAVASAALLGAVATPAFAEGSFTSTVSNAYPGFGSRTWTDKDADGAANYGKIYYCNRSASIAFYRDRQFPVPDEVVGDQHSTCDAPVYYRDGTAGDIHFTIKTTGGSGPLNGNVRVGY